ncbi:hypothetical protein CKY12_19950 [Photorhabdus sp. S12-55]|nr:hypothetical protein A4R40_12160 [Photorhabdus laumondii subsp. laumondii]RAW67623.1 hypothetical protein CKY15_19190 [Photorhabdus sp. S7-51]RAW68503.1 hypothetical protein CKY14_19210 [Photorhabdus sp. S14-60]RAW73876.1 hypothetical protein CKY06_19455 [Photorhabdus sp. S15-56]RAW81300.1 hypothetical protein CKY12_19950 [Photorhabdus sp. S12-55]RAW81325.1 hypothetical protein CKY09_19595 [Photorhabdus sp. S5P8-50]
MLHKCPTVFYALSKIFIDRFMSFYSKKTEEKNIMKAMDMFRVINKKNLEFGELIKRSNVPALKKL